MDSDFKQQHHEEQERGKQLETPLLPSMSEPAAAPAASGGRSKTLLWSFAALFIAAAAVIVAFLLLKQKGAPEQPADPSAAIVHEPREVTQPVAKETSRQLGSDNVDAQKKRAAAHIARAKKQIKRRKWRAALFFLDQVLILDSEHAEARKLLAFVERKATGKTTVASAMEPLPGSEAAADPEPVVALAPTRKARPAVKRPVRTRLAMRPRVRRVRAATKSRAAAKAKSRPAARAKPRPAGRVKPRPAARVKQAGLQVISKPVAMVYLDGIPLGKTPLKGIRLAPGLHNVKLVQEGYLAYVKEVKLESGQERIFEVKLQPKPRKPKKPVVVAARKPKSAPRAAPKKTVAVAKPAAPKKPVAAAPKPAPALQTSGVNFLPRIVKVHAYNRDGRRTKEITRALAMVEQAAGRASKKDAAGTTSGLRTFMYGAHRGSITPIPLYPRRMGLIITSKLNAGKSKKAISSTLVHLYRTKALKP